MKTVPLLLSNGTRFLLERLPFFLAATVGVY